ncbi:DUF2274 domain-containing protein [Hoeflea sp.]|uniref:DUF2274 domain-containing protein n=1 Tax=Hoeflea sp. TaxID=1940281 RepID=UPI003B01FA52
MSPLKLKKLPNRETAKITFTASADLQQMLEAYASLYEAEYGERETIIDLIPYMLETFIDSDRNFRQRNPHDDKSERFLKSSATVPTRATK